MKTLAAIRQRLDSEEIVVLHLTPREALAVTGAIESRIERFTDLSGDSGLYESAVMDITDLARVSERLQILL